MQPHRNGRCSSTHVRSRGSVISEYLVVLAGLLLIFTGLERVLELVRRHHDNYSAVLELLF